MTAPNPILVIGAGLSGLTTARLLTNAGIPAIIFESCPTDRSQGYAISLREFGFSSLLTALGDLPLTRLTKSVAPDRHINGTGWIDQALYNNHTGEALVTPEPEPESSPSILRANRNALRAWIADNGEEELDIRYEHKLKNVSGEIGSVTAEFENGSSYHGILAIAADGVHSTIRSLLLPSVTPDIVPALVYHGEVQLPRSEFEEIIRPHCGKSNILAGVGDGFNTPITICNITSTHVHFDWSYSRPSKGDDDPLYRPNVTAEEAKLIPPELVAEMESRKLAQPWSLLLNGEALKTHRVFNWVPRCVVMKREDVDGISNKGVVFVGDSWHAMPIFGGEGGNHALVDGVELAGALEEAIKKGGDIRQAISVYYDGAWRRCQEAVRRSRQKFYQLHRPMSEWREIAEKRRLLGS